MEKEIVHFKAVGWVLEYAEFEELVITFLCKENIYFLFLSNMGKFKYKFVASDGIFGIYEYLTLNPKATSTFSSKYKSKYEAAIWYAFDWWRAPEKYDFWFPIENKWIAFLKESNFYKKYIN